MPLPILGLAALVLLIGAGVYLYGLTKKWGALVPFFVMLMSAALALPLDWDGSLRQTFWLPLQQQRSNLFLAGGVALALVILAQSAHLRGKAQSVVIWLLLAASIYASLMRFVHEDGISGSKSVVFNLLTLLPLILMPSVVIREFEDFYLILRTIALSSIVWTGMVMVQFVVNPSMITMGNSNRFVGVLSNPQHAGVLLAFFSVVLLWLILNDKKHFRILYIGMLGISSLFLLWTGSRTGLGMTVIGSVAILYTRLGRAILIMPVVAVIAFIAFTLVADVSSTESAFSRLTSTEDTRSGAWAKLIRNGMESPLTGVGIEESEKSENSWLYGFAAFGIGMLSILIVITIAGAFSGMMWFRAKFSLPHVYRPMMDLCLGALAMYFAGAFLEGYMLARVSPMLCLLPIFCSMGSMLSRSTKTSDLYEYDEYGELDQYSSQDGRFADYSDEALA